MDKQTKGAWVVHHGKKVAADVRGAAEFSAIDIAAKSASLLARMAESDETKLGPQSVQAAGRVGGLSPKTDLPACLDQLQRRKLIDRSSTGEVVVLGVTTGTALVHAADLFEDNEPQPLERAAIDLAETTSKEPLLRETVEEYIADTHHIASGDVTEFVDQAAEIGFVDSEGEGEDRLFFNGNLFRRDTASKTRKVLDSLDDHEQRKLVEFQAKLTTMGSMQGTEAVALRPAGERHRYITDALRYGQDSTGTHERLKWAQAAISDFLPNGPALARTVGDRFTHALRQVPAEGLAEIIVKAAATDRLFDAARMLEGAAFAPTVPAFDEIDVEARSILGAMLDFVGVDRSLFASAWTPNRNQTPQPAATPTASPNAGVKPPPPRGQSEKLL